MKLSSILTLIAVAAVCAMIGTLVLGRGTTQATGPVRAEKRLGDQSLGSLIRAERPTWMPSKNANGYAVTATLKPDDPRVDKFADFPVMIPGYLPDGTKIEKVIVSWDPETEKRLVQITTKGKHTGLISEYRLKRRNSDYPKGMYLTTVRQPDGNLFRNLQSNVDGVAVSVAFGLSLSDNEIIKIYKSLK